MLSTWEAIFPTPILRTNIGREFTEEELQFFAQSQGATTDNVLNTRTVDTHVLETPQMCSLRSLIEENINQFARKTITTSERVEFYITQSWINYTKPGQSHHRHSHTNSLFSGVLYISAIRDIDGICFYKNASTTIKPADDVQNPFSATSWRFNVGAGDLILFPSHLTHAVEQNEGGHIRASLAFNTFVRGELGSEQLLNLLVL